MFQTECRRSRAGRGFEADENRMYAATDAVSVPASMSATCCCVRRFSLPKDGRTVEPPQPNQPFLTLLPSPHYISQSPLAKIGLAALLIMLLWLKQNFDAPQLLQSPFQPQINVTHRLERHAATKLRPQNLLKADKVATIRPRRHLPSSSSQHSIQPAKPLVSKGSSVHLLSFRHSQSAGLNLTPGSLNGFSPPASDFPVALAPSSPPPAREQCCNKSSTPSPGGKWPH